MWNFLASEQVLSELDFPKSAFSECPANLVAVEHSGLVGTDGCTGGLHFLTIVQLSLTVGQLHSYA